MMIRQAAAVFLAAVIGLAFTAGAHAQAARPLLIKPPRFGTIHEVSGALLPVVTPRAACPQAYAPIPGGPCFDSLSARLKAPGAKPMRVVGLPSTSRPAGRLTGSYGQAFTLYDVQSGSHGIEAIALPYPASKVQAPRDCFALPGEDVGYVFAKDGADAATESQLVVCGGGADQPHGPYLPQGAAIISDADGWRPSEITRVAGTSRYLAVPDASCPAEFSLRETHCAKPAVLYLQAHPDVPELDLIAAKHTVQAGDRLSNDDLSQWVLKRKTHGFKADGRWFAKSMFTPVAGCYGLESLRWHVGVVADGFDITEKTLSRCGAPPAPVPAATYEAYGEDYYILNCAWDRHKDGSGCAQQAADYLRNEKRKSAIVVVLNQTARPGDHLYDGGYVAYDVARAEMKGDGATLDRIGDDQIGNVSLSNCNPTTTDDHQAHGFVIVRSLGVAWARAYRWMDCPVY